MSSSDEHDNLTTLFQFIQIGMLTTSFQQYSFIRQPTQKFCVMAYIAKFRVRNYTPSCSWDDEADCQKNVVC